MAKAIPEDYLNAGSLKQYLMPEDYQPIKQVSILFIYLLTGIYLQRCPWAYLILVLSCPAYLIQIVKNTSSPDEDSQPTDQFLQVTAYWCPLGNLETGGPIDEGVVGQMQQDDG